MAEVVACPKNVIIDLRDFDNSRELEPNDPDYEQDFTDEEIAAAEQSPKDLIDLLVYLRNSIRFGTNVPQASTDARLTRAIDTLEGAF